MTTAPHDLEIRERAAAVVFLFTGLLLLAFVFLTVHRRPATQLAANLGAARTHTAVMNWSTRGYFASCGLMVRADTSPPQIYRSSTGGWLLSSFVLEKLWMAATGRYSWRLIAWHNQVVLVLTASLLALLAYRLARRLGVELLHAIALGIAVELVHFTFPSNLAGYWELGGQAFAMLFLVIFLLCEERRLTVLQAAAMFALTYMEYILGVMFLVAFAIVSLLLPERPPLRRLLYVLVIPCVAALSVFGVQRLALRQLEQRHAVTVEGSPFAFRSGLDGDATYYTDHLGIAFRRDIARANFPVNRETLFRWPALFFAGVLALLATLAAYARDRVPRVAGLVPVSMAGAYLLYATVFSQAVVVHPYLYDRILVAPLVLAAFALLPALLEQFTTRRGVVVTVAVFCALWLCFFQLRLYALWFPTVQ